MSHHNKQQAPQATSRKRRRYSSPELTVYGALRELTEGGTSQSPEGTGVGNQNKFT
jgi:hypothetical protein